MLTPVPPDLAFLHWLSVDCGYLHVRPLPGGRWAAVHRKAFTHAIVVGKLGDYLNVDDSWCYHDETAALSALDGWDGNGEPGGWFRHPATGRRLCEAPGQYDERGREPAVGEIYVYR